MEEIDIIELLQRVKEGKAPKLIQIGKEIYHIKEENLDLRRIYETVDRNYYWDIADIYFETKIKILDKPIIEEMKESYNTVFKDELDQFILDTQNKINEIIRVINKENKDG